MWAATVKSHRHWNLARGIVVVDGVGVGADNNNIGDGGVVVEDVVVGAVVVEEVVQLAVVVQAVGIVWVGWWWLMLMLLWIALLNPDYLRCQ